MKWLKTDIKKVCIFTIWGYIFKKKKLPQGYSRLEPLQGGSLFFTNKFPYIPVLILPTSEGWKAESTLEPPSGFEHGTPGLGIQHLKDGVLPLFEKVEIIEKAQVPKNVTELKSFLGFMNCYHKHRIFHLCWNCDVVY